MGALSSLPRAGSSLIRNPILLVIPGLLGVIQLPQLLAQTMLPILSIFLSFAMIAVYVVVTPFFQGGLLGMANEALDGSTSFGTFLEDGKSNYLSLFLAYIVLVGINMVLLFFAFIGFAVLASFVLGFSSEGGTTGSWMPLLVVLGIGVLAYAIFTILIQFYAHVIVVDDADLVEAFKTSVALVRRNVVSVLGYSVIGAVGGGVFGAIGGASTLLFSPETQQQLGLQDLGVAAVAGGAVVYVLVIAVGGAFFATYSVSFYRDIRDAAIGGA